MDVRGFFSKAMPGLVGVGIPAIAVALGILLPVQLAQQQAIGGLQAKVDRLTSDVAGASSKVDRLTLDLAGAAAKVDRLSTDVAGVQSRLETAFAALDKRLDALDAHLTQTESDPQKLIASYFGAGAKAQPGVATVAMIGGQLVSFPKTAAAQEAFAKAGYQLVAVSPTIQGFVAPGQAQDKPSPAGSEKSFPGQLNFVPGGYFELPGAPGTSGWSFGQQTPPQNGSKTVIPFDPKQPF